MTLIVGGFGGSANLASSLKINPLRSGVVTTMVVGGFGGSANLSASLKINPQQSGVAMTVVVGGFGQNYDNSNGYVKPLDE